MTTTRPMNPQSYLYGRGYRRLNVHPLAEALRLSTLDEQRRALAEAAARRTTGPADRSRDNAPPAKANDYPETATRRKAK